MMYWAHQYVGFTEVMKVGS